MKKVFNKISQTVVEISKELAKKDDKHPSSKLLEAERNFNNLSNEINEDIDRINSKLKNIRC